MYTTTTATREKVLKAVAATHRAMERHACSKSQFKFKCFSCGEMINRGDKITRCHKANAGMTLRYRGAGGECGLTMAETVFYQAETGKDMWVHIGCNPCYWDEGFDNGDESSPPGLRGVPTEWGCKIDREWEDWTSGPGGESWLIMGVPYFLKVKGYPKEKSMKKRIVHAVTRFQALWRGYIYKKAYPEALLQAQAAQMYPPEMQAAADEEIEAGLSYRQQTCWEEEWRQSNAQRNWLWSGEGREEKQIQVGESYEILMDRGKSNEAVYSAEVIRVDTGIYAPRWVSVKFHYDGEVRDYRQRRFWKLVEECYNFKEQVGIEAKIIGKISTRYRYKGQDST